MESKVNPGVDQNTMAAPQDPRSPPPATAVSHEKGTDDDTLQLEDAPPSKDAAPDGGTRAWLVAAGTGCVLFATMGYTNSFGIFQAYYVLHQLEGETPDNISWIGSTQVFVTFLTGSVAGPLFDRFGANIIRPAAVVYLFAVMMTSLCKEYYQFILAQGILTGVACGLLMIPSMSALTQHFNARRGAAMGVAMAGSSIGAIVFPLVISSLLNDTSLGFGWTFRIGGFLMLPPLAFALLTVSSRLPPRRSSFFLPRAFADRAYSLLVAAAFFLLVGMFIPLVYLPSYAVKNGMSEVLSSNLVAIVNAASIPGRIVPGILGDRFGRLNILLAAGLATSVLSFCWVQAASPAGIIVLGVFFGLASGTIVSGISIVLAQCAGLPEEVGTYMGQGFAAASVSVLIALPAAGALLRTYGGFQEMSFFCGAMTMAGALLVVAAKASMKQGVLGRV